MRRFLTAALVAVLALYLFPAIAAGRPIFAGRPLVTEMDGGGEAHANESPGTGTAMSG